MTEQISDEDMQKVFTLTQEVGANFIQTKLGRTRDLTKPRVELVGPTKKVFLDDPASLRRILEGDINLLLKIMAGVTGGGGDLSAIDLLSSTEFKQAAFSQIPKKVVASLGANRFLQEVSPMPDNTLPVFYGSTSGINFAEVVETIICAQTVQKSGKNSEVIFDYDGLESRESRVIFDSSMVVLPTYLRERGINFLNTSSKKLMASRLRAISQLLARMKGLPPVNLIDGLDIFAKLGDRFSLGSLLLLAKIAGQNPRLFGNGKGYITANSAVTDLNVEQNGLAEPVSSLVAKGLKPAGFTYYGRDDVIGRFEGAMALPFKLTDKANIYKIMANTASLFSPERGRGIIILPITRQRIVSEGVSSPFDPIALNILAMDQPLAFEDLMRDFFSQCRVFSAREAIKAGTSDNRFIVEKYFNLGDRDG